MIPVLPGALNATALPCALSGPAEVIVSASPSASLAAARSRAADTVAGVFPFAPSVTTPVDGGRLSASVKLCVASGLIPLWAVLVSG